jgi:16S rRNA (guanine527-N7)-methyltransferase
METGKNLLLKGIETLCQNDKDVEKLTAGRLEEIVSLLERYVKEIELFNAAYGLVAVDNTRELIIRHILDSIAPLGIIFRLMGNKTGARQIVDAGSGAGLPGIPLAITLPNCNFTLIERMGRRAGFLHNTRAVLGINNIIVEEGELEKTKKQFSLITFRAFKPLEPKLLKVLFNAANSGLIAAYKGKREKIEQEMSQLGNICKWEAIPYTAPFLDEERHILVVREQA